MDTAHTATLIGYQHDDLKLVLSFFLFRAAVSRKTITFQFLINGVQS